MDEQRLPYMHDPDQNAEITLTEEDDGIEIAVVGMAGRFPGAKDLDEFWHNLSDGIESTTFFSEEELLEAGVSPEVLRNPNYVKAAAILGDVMGFDADFFEMSPREAEITDPQHRLLLECAWQALENAGYTPESHQGNIGVFAGASTSPYVFNVLSQQPSLQSSLQANHGQPASIGTNLFSLSTRISYKLNLHGPSLNVQTACSTGLVATHLACQSLLSYQCDMALAGGVSVKIPQHEGYFYQPGGIASPDGHCRAFDSEAQGTTFGSGAGVVVLKRLEDAIAAKDTIYAVIKGSAINNDGSAKVSYTAPSVDGQAEVISLALGVAGVDAETITYVEAHGTGTAMGDPIEVAALTQAFRRSTTKKQFCGLGSVKSNIGHLDAAAGLAGLIKTILMLKHKMLLPSIHCTQPTPVVNWAESPFYVNRAYTSWPAGNTPRRAGVSAFGFGGTNAHIILEEAPLSVPQHTARPYQLLPLSAHTPTALNQATELLANELGQQTHRSLADISFTLQTGRHAFSQRRVIIAQDCQEAAASLRSLDQAHVFSGTSSESKDRPVAFLFPGQGAQYVNMARDLYEQEAVFRQTIDLCAEQLLHKLNLDIRTILYQEDGSSEQAVELLNQTYITQPALFIVEYALAQQWMAWGIQPQALLGHSIGEYVATCIAGVMTLEDALKVVALRGHVVQQQAAGAMLGISLAPEEVTPFLVDYAVELAAINGPRQCVVSGSSMAIERLEAFLATQKVQTRQLHTSHAFHSASMEPALPILEEAMAGIALAEPSIPFLSNVTGTWITASEATDPHYWAQQLRETVQFSAGLQQLQANQQILLLEVGPGQTLSSLARQQTKNEERVIISSLRHPQQVRNDNEGMLNALGRLWVAGATVNWEGFWSGEQRQRLPLPTYPFERKPYWVERNNMLGTQLSQAAGVRKRPDLAEWFYISTWKRADRVPSASSVLQSKQCWLVFADKSGVGQRIADELQAKQLQVILVHKGSSFVQQNEITFKVNPAKSDDMVSLLEILKARELVPQGVVYLWSLGQSRQEALDYHQFTASQEDGLYCLLAFLQTFLRVSPATRPACFLVTSDLYEVIGGERIQAEQAPLQAIRLILGQEYPGVTCHAIDIQTPQEETLALIGSQLVTELLEPTEATGVALRGRHRWVEAFNTAPVEEATTVLRQQGVYLILGGLGQIGLLIATELAQSVQARLVLIDTRDLAAERWATQKALIEELRASGAEIQVIQADITDLATMRRNIAEIQQRWGDLDGVVHAAGGTQTARGLSEVSRDDILSEFIPRVQGLLILEEALADCQLDFCLIVSSLSSVLGGLGHLAYTAASLFMDAYVQEHNQRFPGRWTSVNWETWKLSSEAQGQATIGAQRMQLSMNAEETVSTFRRALNLTGVSQMVISSGDLSALRRQWITPGSGQQTGNKSRQPSTATNQGQIQHITSAISQSELEEQIVQIYREVLGLERIGTHDNFFELGGDSLLAVQLVAQLRETFAQELSLRSFFEASTPAELASKLSMPADNSLIEDVEQLLQEIEQLSKEEVQALLHDESLIVEGKISHE
jgi:acyl transferase domain-containing protein